MLHVGQNTCIHQGRAGREQLRGDPEEKAWVLRGHHRSQWDMLRGSKASSLRGCTRGSGGHPDPYPLCTDMH